MALILTRKLNEKIYIEIDGDERAICIQVIGINDKVKLAIDAPGDINIAREELLSRPKGKRS